MPVLPHVAVANVATTISPPKGNAVQVPKGSFLTIISESATSATAQVKNAAGLTTGTVPVSDYTPHDPPYAAKTNKPTTILSPKLGAVPLAAGIPLTIFSENNDFGSAQVESNDANKGVEGAIPRVDYDPV